MEFTLYLISHVGTIISLVCLAVAIITFLLCRTLRNQNTYIHLHLCICLFLAKILFLTGADKTDNQVSYPSGFVPIHLPICFCSSSPNSLKASFHLRIFARAFPSSHTHPPASSWCLLVIGLSFEWFSWSCYVWGWSLFLLFKPLVLTWADSVPSGDTWQYMEMLLVVAFGRGCC